MYYGDYGNYSRSGNVDWSRNTSNNNIEAPQVQQEPAAGQKSTKTVSEEELLTSANFYAGMGLNISFQKKEVSQDLENAATAAEQTLSNRGYNPDEIQRRLDRSMPEILAYFNANGVNLSEETETGFFAELDNIADALAA